MAYTTTPTQLRYNDPYQQTIYEFYTDSKLYLSKESNKLFNVMGSDIVIKGMEMSTPSIISTDTVRTTIAAGWAIQDETLVQLTSVSTVDIDCSGLIDTAVGGAHLAVFLNYENVHTNEPNLAGVDLFHVEASGVVNDPFGRFKTRACRILLGLINFTKSGTSVISATVNESATFLASGVTYWFRGLNPDNINIPNLFDIAFKDEREYLLKRDYLLSD